MGFSDLRLYPMPVDTILAVAEAVNFLGEPSAKEVETFAGVGATTAYKALVNASHLGFVKKEDSDKYSYVYSDPLKGTDSAERRFLFRQLLQSFKPFRVLCEFLVYGENESNAKRKTAVLLGDVELEDKVLPALIKWGTGLEILSCGESDQLQLSRPLIEELVIVSKSLEISLGNEFEIGLYLSKRLTTQCYEFLENPERERLARAFKDCDANPESSCEESGKALENFLRLIAARKRIDVSKCNGIVQVAEELLTHKAIHAKHKNMCLALSTVRTVSAHDRDKISNVPWTKTPEIAHAALTYSLSLMKSVYLWAFEGKQEL